MTFWFWCASPRLPAPCLPPCLGKRLKVHQRSEYHVRVLCQDADAGIGTGGITFEQQASRSDGGTACRSPFFNCGLLSAVCCLLLCAVAVCCVAMGPTMSTL